MGQNQGGFSIIPVLLVIVLIAAGVIFYFISSFVVTGNNVNNILESVSVGKYSYKNNNLGFSLSYPKKFSDTISADLKEREDGVDILGHENFYPYFKVTVEWSNQELQTWWESKQANEVKKFYKAARPLILKKESGIEMGFTSGTEWTNQKEYLIHHEGRNYWIILYHGYCSGCEERTIEDGIWDSFSFLARLQR